MKERPLLMSGPLVVKTLADEKTQTRRLVRWPVLGPDVGGKRRLFTPDDVEKHRAEIIELCPHGRSGDRLWVRETYALTADGAVVPRASSAAECSWIPALRWRPSIHMPRWASRLTLEIESVRVERLQDISEEDAKAEGVEPFTSIGPDQRLAGDLQHGRDRTQATHPHTIALASLWDSINGDRPGASWASNPWVWAISFKRVQP